MKILTTDQFSALKDKADQFDKLAAHILENSEGITAQDVTAEAILDMLKPDEAEAGENEAVKEMKKQIQDLTVTLTAAEAERSKLQQEVELLRGLPAEEPTLKTPAGDPRESSLEEVLNFARKNPGNTLAITQKLREIGLG